MKRIDLGEWCIAAISNTKIIVINPARLSNDDEVIDEQRVTIDGTANLIALRNALIDVLPIDA